MHTKVSASVSLENIRVGLAVRDWKDAIEQAAQPLVKGGSIRAGYIDSMIESVQKLGPYIVLMPGFALAHAAPSPDVLRTDISIAVFNGPICFHSDNDPVYVVMCLACKDKASHVQRLQNVAQKFLDDPDLVNRMRSCGTANELFSLLNR